MKEITLFLMLLMITFCTNAQNECAGYANIIAKLELNKSYPNFLLESDSLLMRKLVNNPYIEKSDYSHTFEKDICKTMWRKRPDPNRICCFGPGTCDVWKLDSVKTKKGNRIPIFIYKEIDVKGKYKVSFHKNELTNKKHIKTEIKIDFCKNDTIHYQIERSNGYQSEIKTVLSSYDKASIIHHWELPEGRDTTLYWEKLTFLDLNGNKKLIQYALPFSDEEEAFEEIITMQTSYIIRGMKMKEYYKGNILHSEFDSKMKSIFSQIHTDYGIPVGNIPNPKPVFFILGLHGFMNEGYFIL